MFKVFIQKDSSTEKKGAAMIIVMMVVLRLIVGYVCRHRISRQSRKSRHLRFAARITILDLAAAAIQDLKR